jgi:hypothetical protein
MPDWYIYSGRYFILINYPLSVLDILSIDRIIETTDWMLTTLLYIISGASQHKKGLFIHLQICNPTKSKYVHHRISVDSLHISILQGGGAIRALPSPHLRFLGTQLAQRQFLILLSFGYMMGNKEPG